MGLGRGLGTIFIQGGGGAQKKKKFLKKKIYYINPWF